MLKELLFGNENLEINCQEAYAIWDLTASNYLLLNNLAAYKNFVHDLDLKYIVAKVFDDINSNVSEHEKKLSQIGIGSPDVGVIRSNIANPPESIRDEVMAQNIFAWLQADIENLLRALRTTTTNDDLRNFFLGHLKEAINRVDMIIPFLKIKGWINPPPLYPNIPPNIGEQINLGEAFHLWDHLTFRYDNYTKTEIYKTLAHDTEFKVLLTIGLENVLKKQIILLEDECLKFGMPLPKRPANISTAQGRPTEIISDDYMYRSLIIGIIGATFLHASSFKQCTTNDRIRNISKELLLSEIKVQDKFYKYGKLKGYLNEVPQFKLS